MAASSGIKFMCPTPKDKCCGSIVGAPNGMGKMLTCHNTSKEAQQCYIAYLVSKGYKQVGPRELLTPDNTILVLNKQSKFGQPIRSGKRGEKGAGSVNRFVMKQNGKHGGTTGGVVSI